jgi:hypothetical protein
MLNTNDLVRDIAGLPEHDEALITAFLQGAVYCWVKNRKNEPFALRDLVGGDNTIWITTPLEVLYQRQIDMGKTTDEAHAQAGKDAGWLLKKVLRDDGRRFDSTKEALVSHYTWAP